MNRKQSVSMQSITRTRLVSEMNYHMSSETLLLGSFTHASL